MKNFLSAFFGSCLGILISLGLIFIVVFFAIKGLEENIKGADQEENTEISENGFLKLELSGQLSERESDYDFLRNFDLPLGFTEKSIGLNKLRKCFENAARHEKVKGVILVFKNFSGGMASLEEFRGILEEFKKQTKNKKPLWAYSEIYSHGNYFVASVCDKIFLHPQGEFFWHGLSGRIMFFKEMLQKLGIEVEVFRHGKFKSAVEPFILNKMSEENRRQFESFLNSIWMNMLEQISAWRKIPVDSLQFFANQLAIKHPEHALEKKLVDRLAYWNEVEEELREELQLEKNDSKIPYITRQEVENWIDPEKKIVQDKIAVIYAVGDITSGEGSEETIGSDGLCKSIRKAIQNHNIKAIVLRVNSPGGSALASDVIWKEMVRAREKKPVVVSMSDYAASGGYYISCTADRIFARKNTITGSIGVFGMIANVSGLLKDKFGIYTDTVNTNAYSDIGSMYRKFTDKEKQHIQASVEKVYQTFLTRVSDGRKIPAAQVDSIAQGRVWSGTEALRIGLVDSVGGLTDAIRAAARLAKTENYGIVEYPYIQNPILKFMNPNNAEENHMLLFLLKNKNFCNSFRVARTILGSDDRIWAWNPLMCDFR